MNQEKAEQEFRPLEPRIDKFAGRFSEHDFPIIEHKPRNLPLLVLPQKDNNDEIGEILL